MPSRDDFVWPPKRASQQAPPPPPPPPPPATPGQGDAHAPQSAPASVAPPTSPGSARTREITAARAPADPAWWHDFERSWLGAESLPWARRVRDNPQFLDAPLGVLAPPCPRCGHDLPPAVLDCPACASVPAPPWQTIVRLGPYDALLRDCVLEVKHTAFASLARAMGKDLGEFARERLDTAGIRGPVLVTWVPVPAMRRLSRGIDHARALARGVASSLDAPLVRILSRRHRPTQQGLSPVGRARNVAGSMRPALFAPAGESLSGATIIVVDDVLTTGATMREACKAILRTAKGAQHPPTFVAVVAAVTPPRDAPARHLASSPASSPSEA